jgi:hypothetical protein
MKGKNVLQDDYCLVPFYYAHILFVVLCVVRYRAQRVDVRDKCAFGDALKMMRKRVDSVVEDVLHLIHS